MSSFLTKKLLSYNNIKTLLTIPYSRTFSFTSRIKAEEKIKNILDKSFPSAESIEVIDVSGGCGAMYDISIKAPQFKGLTIVKQHKLVTEALKQEIKDMHGIRIQTTPTG
ncbi:hypothetical protein O3M35_003608 [Rhynocoris fuscipes]|uniref:BolA-like protein 3 n=1 Tax=Rhynocoris fuscipes TaxID=488301 RepID=A0AAW1CKL7_9HEMI